MTDCSCYSSLCISVSLCSALLANKCVHWLTRTRVVIGCPDIVPQDDTWVRRYGDTAIVKCNKTGETFYVTCLDTEWKGELAACSTGSTASSCDSRSLPFWLRCTFLCNVFWLFVVYFVLKWWSRPPVKAKFHYAS